MPRDPFPQPFVDRFTDVLGSRAAIDELMEGTSRPGLRVNTLKTSVKEAVARLEALGIETEPTPFCPEALFYHDPRERGIGNLWEHQAGLIFGQDPASTLPVVALDPQPGDNVLDLCSAPGGKTTHLSQRIENQGLVVANDSSPGRLNNLISNLDRMGCMNVAAVSASGARLQWPITFDGVLVDAPCSNLGSIHQNLRPVYDYDKGRVGHKVGLQRHLLETAFHAVKVGGSIVYSTCTLEPRENEEVVSWFLESHPVRIEPLDLGVGGPGWTEVAGRSYDPGVENALRLMPGEADTDGFFLATFTKLEELDEWPAGRRKDWGGGPFDAGPEGAVDEVVEQYGLHAPVLEGARAVQTPSRLYATTVPDLEEALQLQPDRLGVYLAKEEPDGHRLSFDAATLVGRGADQAIEVTPEEARSWLAGGSVPAGEHQPWSVLTCLDEPIGCSRPFGDQVPCYVPKQRRLPKEGDDLMGFVALPRR